MENKKAYFAGGLARHATAVFAGGCFWCTEHDLREVPGVIDVISGYTCENADREKLTPTYEDHQGCMEAVEVYYDPSKTSFKKLSQFFLDHIDPTDAGGQFFDRGESYKTAIFYKNEEEKNIALALLKELEDSKMYDKPIVVKVFPETKFYKAEEYHQRYAEKNPAHYVAYKEGSGRSDFQANVCMVRDEKKIQWTE